MTGLAEQGGEVANKTNEELRQSASLAIRDLIDGISKFEMSREYRLAQKLKGVNDDIGAIRSDLKEGEVAPIILHAEAMHVGIAARMVQSRIDPVEANMVSYASSLRSERSRLWYDKTEDSPAELTLPRIDPGGDAPKTPAAIQALTMQTISDRINVPVNFIEPNPEQPDEPIVTRFVPTPKEQ